MKKNIIILGFILGFALQIALGQNQLFNYKENESIYWGSLSAKIPNYGFYGQEFDIAEDTYLESISVYIYDHKKYVETKTSINFSILSLADVPEKVLFLSEAQQIEPDEVGSWKTYTFENPMKLKDGKYLFAVGQSRQYGFIAFGIGIVKSGYHNKFWIKSDGREWFDLLTADGPEEVPDRFYDAIVMIRIVVQ